MKCSKREIVSSLKLPLYLVSVAPLIYSWLSSSLSRPLIFALSIIFILSSQFIMNVEMDRLDLGYGRQGMNCSSLLPVGPCIFRCADIKKMRKISLVPLALMVITASLVLIITRIVMLLAFGFLAVVFMIAYLYQPLMLYRRGIGEVSTFFDFGPLLVLGTYYAFTGHFGYYLIPASMGFGLIASAVRFAHHIIEESENSIRKRLYIPIFPVLIIASSLIAGLQFSILHIILILISIITGIMPLITRDSQRVTFSAIIYLIIFTAIA